jgi:hypothetical protein
MSMIGESLAHYSITAEIGKGGMGEARENPGHLFFLKYSWHCLFTHR